MPRPDPDASGPATAVVVGRRVFLVDAGPGIERRLAAAHLPIDGVTALFITHLHSDHTLGYPDLIFTSWVMGRKQPLAAYGPHGLQKMTDHLVAAWAEDIEVRTNGLEKRTPGVIAWTCTRSGQAWFTTRQACASRRSWSSTAPGARRMGTASMRRVAVW